MPFFNRATCSMPAFRSTWSQRSATSSDTRKPWRYANRIKVRSRAPWRPSLLEDCRSFSISSGVKYSRRRREAFVWRGGGRGESGVPRDRRSNGFLLRRREGTFPFSSIGAEFAAADFFEAFAIAASITYPFKGENGKVLRDRKS